MAIVKFGTTVVGVRGTIGGITYSANASGPHARIWSKGSNPQTALQSQIRGRITGLGALWAALSPGDKAAWKAFGLAPPEVDTNSLGEVVHLTGWQWMVRVNQRRQAVGLATTSTVPTSSGVAAPITAAIAGSQLPGGTVTVGWTAGDFPAGYSACLNFGIHPTTGLVSKTTGLLQIYAQHQPAGTSADITAAVGNRFGSVQSGWTLYAHLYKLRDDGVRSTVTVATCEVT
jgi:hypothetical protein